MSWTRSLETFGGGAAARAAARLTYDRGREIARCARRPGPRFAWRMGRAAIGVLICTIVAATPATGGAMQGEELGLITPTEEGLSQEDRDQAVKFLFDELNSLTPGDVSSNPEQAELVKQAIGSFIDGKISDATNQLDAFRRLNEHAPPTSLMLAAMYFALNDPAQGMRHLEDAAIIAPGLPTVYNAFARVAIVQQRRTDALVLLEKVKRLVDDGQWTEEQRQHFMVGYFDATADLMMLRRDFNLARNALGELAKLKSDLPRIPLRMAEIAFEQEKLDESLEHLAEFRKVVPTAQVPEIMLATFYARRGDITQAERWLETANTKYVGDSRVGVEYVDFMVNREKFDKAKEAIAALEAQFEKLPELTLLKGKVAFAEERFADAEALFNELLQTHPENFEVANLWAMALAESDRADHVAQALRQAQANVQRVPNNGVACAILALVYLKQCNLEQAQGWLGRAGQSGQLTPEVGYIFARFLQTVGERARALEFLEGALQHQGFFLYRRAAQRLREALTAEGQSGNSGPS